MLEQLRALLDQQQFAPLLDAATHYFAETGDIQALPLQVLAHAHLGQRQQVTAVLEQLKPHRNELSVEAQGELAAVLLYLGRIDQGRLLLRAVLGQSPDQAFALAQLAWLALRDGQPDAALRDFSRAFELNPGMVSVWFNLIKLLLVRKDSVGAQTCLDRAVAHFQAHSECFSAASARHQKACLRSLQLEIWSAADDLAQAEEWLNRRADDLDEDEWVPLVAGWASLHISRDNHDKAEEALRDALKRYPKNIPLYKQLADVTQAQGRHFQAANLLRRAIRVSEQEAKDNAPLEQLSLQVRLADAVLHQNETLARTAAEKAVEIANGLVENEKQTAGQIRRATLKALTTLARVESQEQRFDEAEKLFQDVLEREPNYLPALQGLGHQEMQRGNLEAAVALFERVRVLDPARGYSSLINARQFPEDEAVLHKMEKLARQPNLHGSINTGMLFQLAAAWEKRKDYDKAFQLAREANEASKKLLRYDPKAHRQTCARIRHAFPKALYDHRPDCGHASTLPVYVVGMPRSGTTLVEQILAGHSKICGAGELGVIPQVIAGLERWERHVGSGREFPDCIDDLSPEVSRGIAENVLKELREFDAEAAHVVDKLPHNFQNIGLIKFLFPRAKIISVRRDPRDIAVSNYFTDYQAKHGGMGFAYDLRHIGEQLADHNLMLHYWNELFPGEILEVSYEELVEDLEGVSRRMLDYIGVEWEPEVLAFNELDRPVKTASVWQVRQPVYKSSKAKWMRYKEHLAPLFEGTNAKIQCDPIEMVTLPEPGLLTQGVELYKQDKLDDAEYTLKKLLHHVPEHAAANFLVGLIYLRKGHTADGIALMEKGYRTCPWNPNWYADLLQAYEMTGNTEKAEALQKSRRRRRSVEAERVGDEANLLEQEAG